MPRSSAVDNGREGNPVLLRISFVLAGPFDTELHPNYWIASPADGTTSCGYGKAGDILLCQVLSVEGLETVHVFLWHGQTASIHTSETQRNV